MTRKLFYFAILLAGFSLSGCKDVETDVTVTYEGEGRVVEGASIDCPDTCEATYSHSPLVTESITFKAEPSQGFEIFGWDGCGLGDSCVRQLTSVCTLYSPTGVCEAYDGVDFDLHAIFVPEGSIVDYAADAANKCFINTDGEFRCWPETFATDMPEVLNPAKVYLSGGVGCVTDDSGLQCWGNRYIADTPFFEEPEMLVMNDVLGCGLDQGKPLCWGSSGEHILDGPILTGVTGLNVYNPYSGVCADSDQGRVCWGRIDSGLRQPSSFDAELYALADESTCAYSEQAGLACWGNIAGAEVVSPQLENPQQLGVGWNHICAQDNQGLRCWKDGALIDLPDPFNDSISFQQSGTYICGQDNAGIDCWHLGSDDAVERVVGDFDLLAISQRGGCLILGQNLHCWGDANFWPASNSENYTTTITQPKALAVNNNGFCIAGLDGVDCQYHNQLNHVVEPPEDLTNTTEIVMGPDATCAVIRNQLRCWGSRAMSLTSFPEMTNVRNVKIGYSHACADSDQGVQCWGWIRPLEE
ncbi:MAG: hypothetical protein MI867_00125 [Pseudomonadales bacterium]|nr:hypothetical protein [Pseudomonadales bacterium]